MGYATAQWEKDYKEHVERLLEICRTILFMDPTYSDEDLIAGWGFACVVTYLIFHTKSAENLAGTISEIGPEAFNIDVA